MKNKNESGHIAEYVLLFQLFLFILVWGSWLVNLIKLLNCDFAAPWREEIIHAIGLIPIASVVTVWM